MEIKEVNKTDFAVIVKQNGNESRQFVLEDSVWYEQLTVGDIQYRHKLITVRQLSKELLEKKAQEVQPGVLPIFLRERAQGEILALVCSSKTVLYYYLPLNTKERKIRAQQIVFNYAKSLIAKSA